MSYPITLAPDLHLPVDFCTQKCGIIGRSGSGKTNTAVVLAEELLSSGHQIVVLDPLDVWWGLRSSKDGKHKGFPVVVFGGDHGDVPLTEHMGVQIADVIVDRNLSAIISLAHLSKSATKRFAAAFAERIYDRKSPQEQRTPVHMFVDEADIFVPQRMQPDDARMLGAFGMIARRGRVRGMGVTIITQRPATTSKDVLTQIELLVCLQVTAPQDRKALLEWVEAKADEEHKDEFMSSIAGFKRGEAWVWSPSWLNIFKRVQIRERQSFDSSETPTAGKRQKAPTVLAPVDIEKLRVDMAESIAKAEQDDPVKLRREIAALKAQIAKAPKPAHKDMISPVELEKACWQVENRIKKLLQTWVGRQRKELKDSLDAVVVSYMEEAERSLGQALSIAHAASVGASEATLKQMQASAAAAPENLAQMIRRESLTAKEPTPRPTQAPWRKGPTQVEAGISIGKGERAILAALAQSGRPCTAQYVGILTDYSSTSGTFGTYLGKLRTLGYVEGTKSNLSITEDGRVALGEYTPFPTGQALIDYWLNRLGRGESAILRVLVDHYPNAVTKEEIGNATGYSSGSGTFGTYLGKLRTLGLVEARGEIRATDMLMGAG